MTGKEQLKAQGAEFDAIVEAHTTTSARIRALYAAGFSKMAIAEGLGKRYQHVRNVLITPLSTK